MAELKAEVVKIDEVLEHPNADRMELAMVGGYQVCVQLASFKAGDLAIYIPVDSILPSALEAQLFGPDAKVKLHNHRVRAIKLRGAVSQGMLMSQDDFSFGTFNKEGEDVTEVLGITKYQPPVAKQPQQMKAKAKRHCHPMFSKYTDIGHLKKYWNAFEEGEGVIGTEKLHGTNFRCGWVPFVPRTLLQKLKNIFGLNKPWEFVYGSHNVQLMDGKGKNAFSGNTYKRIVDDHDLVLKVPLGQLWYGEIIGDHIQTGYSYGYKNGAVDVFFMDIKDSVTQKYMSFGPACEIIEVEGEKMVPYAAWVFRKDEILKLLNNPKATSEIDKVTKPIEGFVIRSMQEEKFYGGRKILKILSDDYLLRKDNTDWK